MKSAALCILLLLFTPVFGDGYEEMTFQDPRTPRDLQTSGENLGDIIGDKDACTTYGGLEFGCGLYQRVGSGSNFVDINITIVCELGEYQFDFRRVSGCGCVALMTPSNASRVTKTCPCTVCPRGFGSSSVAIDCTNYEVVTEASMEPTMVPTSLAEAPSAMPSMAVSAQGSSDSPSMVPAMNDYDPFIFDTCSSIDCAANCNGTCALGCGLGAGPTCQFCFTPTLEPTGDTTEDGLGRLGGGTSGATMLYQYSGLPVLAVLLLGLVL
jgi:hypothetical protein